MLDTVTVTLTRSTCPTCGVVFGIPDVLCRELKQSGDSFYCPNGHKLHYGASENKRLRRELERERNCRIHAEEWGETAQRSLRATKGHLTRLRNRIVNGICPFCRRHFENLDRHVQTQHPKQRQRYSTLKGEQTCQGKH